MTDWVDWHRAYDSPTSSLARRLAVVQRRLGEALDAVPTANPRILSLCAGDGRDVLAVLGSDHETTPATVMLVEKDETLARRAVAAADQAGLDAVEVRCGDASDPGVFDDFLPADVLLLCGIFGNIDHAEARKVIAVLPKLLATGGLVIWTRGGSTPDRRLELRRSFRSAGFDELSFDGAPEPYGVGLNRMSGPAPEDSGALSGKLFTFVR